MNTFDQYKREQQKSRTIFVQKNQDYGQSWRLFRLPSITDQMIIKAKRIRQLEIEQKSEIGEGVEGEYQALVNYGVMALIQMDHKNNFDSLPEQRLFESYDEKFSLAYELMLKKNADYGEAWKELRISSITDLILVKLDRIKSIEDSGGEVKFSEGVDSNYLDIINYSIFALITLNEKS